MLFKNVIQSRLISIQEILASNKTHEAHYICVPENSSVDRDLVKVVKINISTVEICGESHQLLLVEEVHIPRYQRFMTQKLSLIVSALYNS